MWISPSRSSCSCPVKPRFVVAVGPPPLRFVSRPGSLVLQYHGGVFVSDDAGDSWKRISAGLPHDFGFPLAVTTRGEFFVVPLVADTNRVVPNGALRVWRTRDRGRTWRAMTKGLPQKDHFVGVLREPGAIFSCVSGP